MNESTSVYLRLKSLFTGLTTRKNSTPSRRHVAETEDNQPFSPGRDPRELSDVLTSLTTDLGWSVSLAESDLLAGWRDLAGEKNAEHSYPESINDGVLVIRCDSSAWATQLRLMRSQLLTRAAQSFPRAAITTIHFYGPDAPSWNHGPRSIPGRGPRDTYG